MTKVEGTAPLILWLCYNSNIICTTRTDHRLFIITVFTKNQTLNPKLQLREHLHSHLDGSEDDCRSKDLFESAVSSFSLCFLSCFFLSILSKTRRILTLASRLSSTRRLLRKGLKRTEIQKILETKKKYKHPITGSTYNALILNKILVKFWFYSDSWFLYMIQEPPAIQLRICAKSKNIRRLAELACACSMPHGHFIELTSSYPWSHSTSLHFLKDTPQCYPSCLTCPLGSLEPPDSHSIPLKSVIPQNYVKLLRNKINRSRNILLKINRSRNILLLTAGKPLQLSLRKRAKVLSIDAECDDASVDFALDIPGLRRRHGSLRGDGVSEKHEREKNEWNM